MVSSAARVGSISVLLSVQHGAAMAGMNAFATGVEKAGIRTQRAVGGIDRSTMSMNRSMRGIGANAAGFRGLTISALRTRDSIGQLNTMLLATTALVGGLTPALLATGMVRMADRAKLLENQLRTVTSGTEDLKNVNEELFQVAQRTRSSFEATAVIYARTARATEHFGYSQEKLLRIAETVQKAFAVGGANSAEARGAAIQLTQGIASDRFSGEEFRSVAENAPVLLRGIAESLGVNIGKLREMAHAGELTAKVVTEAIVEASARIDEEFARTTSTIGQAMVKLDNAILKYVGDSKNVSVASMGIVTVVNAVAENLDTVTDSLLLLGGALVSIMAGRPLNAIQQNTMAMGAHLAMVKQSTAASLQQTKVEAAASAQRLASARAYYSMVTQGTASEATRVRAARQLHAANVQNLASQKALVLATKEHGAALAAASIQGRAFAAAGRAGSAAWAFIGGPFGAALLAVGAAMYVVSRNTAQAENAAQEYKEIMDKVETASTEAAKSVREVGEASVEAAEKMTAASARVAQAEAIEKVAQNYQRITDLAIRFGQEIAAQRGLPGTHPVTNQIIELRGQLERGEITLDQFNKKVDEFINLDSRGPEWVKGIQEAATTAEFATGRVNGLTEAVENLDGKEANVTIRFIPEGLVDGGVAKKGDRPGADPMDVAQEKFNEAKKFASRLGWDELFDFPSKTKSGGGGRRGHRKDADDRFANSVQKIRDRIVALQEEQIALGLNFREQERRRVALELEQEALKQVREEARRKGEQDWQNAQLSPEQIEKINEVADAYARQAAELKYAVESQEALNGAANEFGGILKGLADGTLEWQDALISVSKVVLKLLNDMKMAGGGRGIFGGGLFQNLLGGLLGVSFHTGGTVGAGGKVGPQVSGAPYVGKFHGGGNPGGRRATHKELLATVEEGETILTGGQTARAIATMSAATERLKEGRAIDVRFGLADDGMLNIYPTVKEVADGSAAEMGSRVARSVPAMVDGRIDEGRTRRIRPSGTF